MNLSDRFLKRDEEPSEKSIFEGAKEAEQAFQEKYKEVIKSIIDAFENKSTHTDIGSAGGIVGQGGGHDKVSGRVEYQYKEAMGEITVRYVHFINDQGKVAEFRIQLPDTVSPYDVPKLMQEVLFDNKMRYTLNFFPTESDQHLGLFSIDSSVDSTPETH